jgi:hypothetical protein
MAMEAILAFPCSSASLEWLLHAARASPDGLFPGQPGIIHPQRHVANPVAVQPDVLGYLVVRP